MYKRVIGFILAICLILPVNMSVFALESESDYSRAFDLITGLGFDIPDDERSKMTRAQYAQLVSDVINFRQEVKARNGQFKDVTAKDSFSGAVYDLYLRGAVSGNEEGLFKPDDAICTEQAVKILLSLMGYDKMAAYSGGYPQGYMSVADRYDMLDKIHKISGEELTVGDAVQLVANAINTEVLVQSSFGGDEEYKTYEDVTLLTEFMNLQKQDGIITDNGITALTGATGTEENWIKINGKYYDATGTNACDFLGYRVEAYVTVDDVNVEKVIYAQVHKKVDVQHIEAKRLLPNDSAFSVTNIVYEDVYGKRKAVKVDIAADFIYNGTAHVDLRADDLKITNGELILIDNNDDGIFEVVNVRPMQTIVVAGVHLSSYTMYDKYGNAPIVLNDNIKVRVKRDGVPAMVEDILPWDVVSAYVSYDKSFVELEVSSKTLKGDVQSYNGTDMTIQIDGEYYHCINASVLSEVNIGSVYEFCVDMQNNVAAVKTEQTENAVAYFRKVQYDQTVDKVMLRIYTPSGEHLQFYCSNRVTADGNSFDNYQACIDYLNSNAIGKLAEYSVDKQGEIRRIFTPYVGAALPEDRKGDLHQYYDAAGVLQYYSVNQQSFAGKITLSNKTKVFHIPTNTSALEDYSIKDYNYFRNQNGYDFKAYAIGAEDGLADYLVMVADTGTDYTFNNQPMVVSKIRTGLDADNQVCEYITGCGYLGEEEYWGATDSIFTDKGVKKGDIIRCITNIQGVVTDVRKVYDASSNTIVSTDEVVTDYWAKVRSLSGSVFLRYGDLVGITTANLSAPVTETERVQAARSALEYHNVKSAKIYAVDKNNSNAVTEISVDGIYDYQQFRSEYSKVYMYASDANPRLLVVYN